MTTIEDKRNITKLAGKGFGSLFGTLSELIPFVGPFVGPLVGMGVDKLTNYLGTKIIDNYNPPRHAINNTNFMVNKQTAYSANKTLPIEQSIRRYNLMQAPVNTITQNAPNEFLHGSYSKNPVINIQKSNNTSFPLGDNQNSNASYGTAGFTYKNKNMKFKNVI